MKNKENAQDDVVGMSQLYEDINFGTNLSTENNKNEQSEEEKKFEAQNENFIRIIRTPISSRTFIIGGNKNFKKVREIVLDITGEKDKLKIETIKWVNKPIFRKKLNIFDYVSDIIPVEQQALMQYKNEKVIEKDKEKFAKEINDIISKIDKVDVEK